MITDVDHHNHTNDQMNDFELAKYDSVQQPLVTGRQVDNKYLNSPVTHAVNLKVVKSQARDFNYPDKTMGYLAQANTDFVFIGPDREPKKLDSVDTLINIANIVRDTDQPNYKYARTCRYSFIGSWFPYV